MKTYDSGTLRRTLNFLRKPWSSTIVARSEITHPDAGEVFFSDSNRTWPDDWEIHNTSVDDPKTFAQAAQMRMTEDQDGVKLWAGYNTYTVPRKDGRYDFIPACFALVSSQLSAGEGLVIIEEFEESARATIEKQADAKKSAAVKECGLKIKKTGALMPPTKLT